MSANRKREYTDPVHGYCTVCDGRIDRGMQWTLTGQMNRVHADPDRCIEALHPAITKAFIKANPRYEWPGYKPCEWRT